jgi:hypothetical protein
MRLCRRQLAPGETDHELVWLVVSVGSLALGATWLALDLPWPRCVFRELTGLPCVTCGMTRCAIHFFHGHFSAALNWNPLMFAFLCGIAAFDLYALFVVVTRGPRLRICFCSKRAKTFGRVAVLSALGLNWFYLLLHWRNF